MFRCQNPKLETIWSLCHVVSLIIKHGLLEIRLFKELLSKVKELYDYFTNSITDQLFDGVCMEDDVKCDQIQNAIDKEFNNLNKPTAVIMNNYQYIMSTLKFIKNNKNCKKARDLYIFFGKIDNLFLIAITVDFTIKCQSLISLISLDLIDIM